MSQLHFSKVEFSFSSTMPTPLGLLEYACPTELKDATEHIEHALDEPAACQFEGQDSVLPKGVVGDLGIEVSMDRFLRLQKDKSWVSKPRTKPKRKDVEPQWRVCRDCGTTDSPEWRKGPAGRKTLCNACGRGYISMT